MMTIGKIAKEAGVGVETVRFYERKGLLKRPVKKPSEGFRSYKEEDAKRIRFIKRAQELGFTLKEVAELLALNEKPEATCGDVKLKAQAKLEEIESKLKDLKKMKDSLREIEAACDRSKKAVACCRITDCFEGNC